MRLPSSLSRSARSNPVAHNPEIAMFGHCAGLGHHVASTRFSFFLIYDYRRFALENDIFTDNYFLDPLLARHIVHDVQHCFFKDCTQSACTAFALYSAPGDGS